MKSCSEGGCFYNRISLTLGALNLAPIVSSTVGHDGFRISRIFNVLRHPQGAKQQWLMFVTASSIPHTLVFRTITVASVNVEQMPIGGSLPDKNNS